MYWGEKDSGATKYTLTTLNMLRKHADFDEFDPVCIEDSSIARAHLEQMPQVHSAKSTKAESSSLGEGKKISLSYTINLNLPASKDVEVFNAIFKSLKEHILGD